jgi:hypothetical protein
MATEDDSEAHTLATGVKVWVPDPLEAWVAAEVRSVDGGKVTVQIAGAKEAKQVVVADCNLMEKTTEARTGATE